MSNKWTYEITISKKRWVTRERQNWERTGKKDADGSDQYGYVAKKERQQDKVEVFRLETDVEIAGRVAAAVLE